MSLTDLKKSNQGKRKKKDFTVDEFIADAENYAKGHPEIVSNEADNKVNIEQAIKAAKQQLASKKTKTQKPYRHATFTLSEQAIAQLQTLAIDTNLAKSHIIRILINELCVKEQHDKLQNLLESDID